MNSWFVWLALVLTVLVLGLAGYYFSLATVRATAACAALATVVYITWYGLTHPAKLPSGSFSDAFTRGADALFTALFRWLPVPPGHSIPEPGRIGWLIIAALLVIGYRELEAWALHHQAPSLDTSALTPERPNAQQNDSPGNGSDVLTDRQRHDRLAAELKFRLPAVELRSPAILPGGSRSSELASIAEASDVTGSGLAGAVIRFFGMLWPSPRRVRVRVWVEWAAGRTRIDDVTKVTVGLDDPRTGAGIATKTLAAGSLDDAASVVAGYVAQHIFAEDPTAPPWCTAAADGGDLAALLLARQVRVYPESEQRVRDARSTKIGLLENVARNNLCAGVARYELAHLYDLNERHVEALRLHAVNREQYPRFYRGRYRLAMSLEMIANPDPGTRMKPEEVPNLDETLRILHRCGLTKFDKSGANCVDGTVDLPSELRSDLLEAAWNELQEIRRYLTLRHVIWQSFRHRDERGILKPYWQLRHRQAFHDGVCVALLLVAVRRALHDQQESGLAPTRRPEGATRPGPARRLRRSARRLPRARTVLRIATAIAGDSSDIAVPGILPGRPARLSERGARPLAKRLRIRRRPGQCSTRSWQAAYNLACVYAAIAHDRQRRLLHDEVPGLVGKVITSLEFAVNIPECEMERPGEWIATDPDFSCLHSGDDQFCPRFNGFLAVQNRSDCPPLSRTGPEAAAMILIDSVIMDM